MSHRHRSLLATVLVLGAASLVACSDGDGEPADGSTSGSMPLVVDTDAGADDAIALLSVLGDPAVDVRAVTVSGTGLARCDAGVRIVRGLIDLAAPGREIDVACGPEVPLAGGRAFPEEWRDRTDGGYGGVLPIAAPLEGTADAIALLGDAATEADGGLVVLALGPMTNLAAALDADEDLAGRIDRVVAMGGAFEVPGNVDLDAEPAAASTEWNIYVDPTAAAQVLASGVDTTFVPIDSQVPIGPYLRRSLAEAGSPAATLVADLVASDPFFTSGGFFLWDPLAAAAVTRPAFLAGRSTTVDIATDGPEAGRTIGEATGAAPATVATLVNTDAFLGHLVTTLAGEPATFSREPDLVADITTAGGCGLSTDSVPAGPSVVVLRRPGTALAIGTLDPGRTAADVDAYLLSGGVDAPPWFPTVGILMGGAGAVAHYVDLPEGPHDAVCVVADPETPTVGIETLDAT